MNIFHEVFHNVGQTRNMIEGGEAESKLIHGGEEQYMKQDDNTAMCAHIQKQT